jgi:predicted RNA-binding Zn-ribbon protein involved in translation (DUF1610 family)
MSNFRIKKDKTKKNSEKKSNKGNTTLDKKHKQHIKYFKVKKNSVVKLKNELERINKRLKEIDKKDSINIDMSKRAELLNKKDELISEIDIISKNIDEMDYYDKAGDLITDYYDLRDNVNNKLVESKSILEYLNNNKISDNDSKKINRAKIFEKFCQRIDGIRVNIDDGSKRIKYCADCQIEKILDHSASSYICPECGIMEEIIIDEDRRIKEYSPYKRLNHFREWLNQFQAKESTEIQNDVCINIIKEINRNRIKDLSELNRDKMQCILKKLGYNHLYEHIPYIINKLSNLPPPKISGQTEQRFLKMFMMIQEPWEIYKPKGRKNFLSYSYILYKFCELLELDELLEYFPLLKSPTKLMEQDQVWKKFCKFLKWEFYSTFK